MPTSRRLGYLLIASLAVNLFLGGLYAGQWLEDWRRGPESERAAPMRFHLGRFVDHLPQASREVARQAVERHRAEIRGAIQGIREARRQAGTALRAEPFAPEELEAALTKLRGHAGEAHQAMHQAMAEMAAKLPPEGRQALAETIERPRQRRGDRR